MEVKMQINNVSNTNFQGGFRLINVSPKVKNELPNVIKKHRQIFDNFEKQGDVFITVRDEANKKIIKFIKDNKIDFEFYPTINTKSGLDNEKPSELTNLIEQIKDVPIKTMTQFRKYTDAMHRKHYIKKHAPEYTDKILKALCIDNKHPVKEVKGAIIVSDKEFNREILISPPSKYNIHYVKVVPKGVDGMVERYAIDTDGNILSRYQSPNGMKMFNNKFNSLLIK